MEIKSFAFGPFEENTYILFDSTKECIIIDTGCANRQEEKELEEFISNLGLKPQRLLNTHTHIDHILGNKFVSEKYKLGLEFCEDDMPTFKLAKVSADMWGINYTPSPEPVSFIKEGDKILFGNCELDVILTPGHSPGSICFINHSTQDAIVGDVLFNGSIGRTDLPGGNFETLINSIKSKLMPLPHNYDVYSGHGPKTTIGYERQHNPFLD
jgi:hydroxyacylglutathione hydrolase